MRIEELPDETVIAPGAFASSVGKIVPVKNETGAVIGTARVLDADGAMEFDAPGLSLPARVSSTFSART